MTIQIVYLPEFNSNSSAFVSRILAGNHGQNAESQSPSVIVLAAAAVVAVKKML